MTTTTQDQTTTSTTTEPKPKTVRKPRPPKKTGNPVADREQNQAPEPTSEVKPEPEPTPEPEAPEPEGQSTGGAPADFAAEYLTRPPTQTVLNYLAWLSEVTGLTFTPREIQIAFIVQSPLRQRWQRLNRETGK